MDINQAAAASDEDFLKNFDQIIDKVPEGETTTQETPELETNEPSLEAESSAVVPESTTEHQDVPVESEADTSVSVESFPTGEEVQAGQEPVEPKTPELKPTTEAAQVDQYKSLY